MKNIKYWTKYGVIKYTYDKNKATKEQYCTNSDQNEAITEQR